MRVKLSVVMAIGLAGPGVAIAVAQSGGEDVQEVARTGPIDAASLETSAFELCNWDEPFNLRRARLHFAAAIRNQDIEIARLTDKYAELNPRRLRAPVKGGTNTNTRARWREEIAKDAWALRFMVEDFVPLEHYPRAIHRWPDKLKSKRPAAEKDAGQLALLKVAFLQSMFDLSPGSNDSAAQYVDDIATLWSMSSPAEPGDDTEPPTLEDLLAQWQMIRTSYPAFKAALEQTLNDRGFEQVIWSNVKNQC